VAGPASAADPGRWTNTGVSRIPLFYYQGVTSDPSRNFYFDGIYTGLFKTDPALRQTAANPEPGVIPPAVRASEQYNHIGDISYGTAEGGRVLLPLECYYPGSPGDANTCQNGAIGVADAATLTWRYYVKLDPAGIKKAMWVERSPDGTLLWTSDGDDLVAYKSSDVNPLNAGTTISEVKRLKGAVPPAGVTGAVFYNGRLFTAGQDGDLFQVYSTDLGSWDSSTQTGDQRLEIELPAGTVGESEGLAVNSSCGGVLHWIVTPFNTEGKPPTYGAGGNALLDFVPAGSQPSGSACQAIQPGSGPASGSGSGTTQLVGGSPPSPAALHARVRLGRTRGMRFAHRGRPFRIRARALGSGFASVRLTLIGRGGHRLGRSRVFGMRRGRLLRPHLRVGHRLARGSYTIVASARTPDGTKLRSYRRHIIIRRR
jgi:hypothetical protein